MAFSSIWRFVLFSGMVKTNFVLIFNTQQTTLFFILNLYNDYYWNLNFHVHFNWLLTPTSVYSFYGQGEEALNQQHLSNLNSERKQFQNAVYSRENKWFSSRWQYMKREGKNKEEIESSERNSGLQFQFEFGFHFYLLFCFH